jgi:NAD(P)-dependent dehydrogenase (short-subunit alcohol dehydrogenase family)
MLHIILVCHCPTSADLFKSTNPTSGVVHFVFFSSSSEVAETISVLASPKSSYITGACIEVTGKLIHLLYSLYTGN